MSRVGWSLVAAAVLCALGSSGAGAEEPPDPHKGRVPLPAGNGWQAELVHDQGKVGIWVAKAFRVLDGVGSDQLVTLDDEGRIRVHVPYSGRWTPIDGLKDGAWLNGLAFGDLDPAHPGAEIYTGGQRGNLWEVPPHPHGALEARLIAHLPGEEIQTLVVGDLDPSAVGREMLVFAWPGRTHVVRPTPEGLKLTTLGTPAARVRDAALLPAPPGAAPEIAVVARDGRLSLVRLEGDALTSVRDVTTIRNGLARIALGATTAAGGAVLYAVSDDGLLLRASRASHGGDWTTETVFASEGLRGVAYGRFSADPAAETVAVFGYGRKVEVLTRGPGGAWSVETAFEDRDKGHWLCAGEIDGRNATDELFLCGYGGRVVALSRQPGYGRPGLLVAPPAKEPSAVRIGVGAVRRELPFLTPLVYHGGFTTKTPVYETLVRMDAEGRPGPGLASSLERLDGGTRWVFTLREGATFHDGRPCDAAAVADHFNSWIGRAGHDWLGLNHRVTSVKALDARRVEFTLNESYPLVLDLAAVNPCAVAAPSARPDALTFAPVGTGPYRVTKLDAERGIELAPTAGGRPVELRFLQGGDVMSTTHVRALDAGDVDVIADGWTPLLPRDDVARLAADPRFQVVREPGTSVVHVAFARGQGAFADAAVRRRFAAAVDRALLVREAANGFAAPCETLFAPGVGGWPRARVLPPDAALPDGPRVQATLLVGAHDPDAVRTATALARQVRAKGFDLDLVALGGPELRERLRAGGYDLSIDATEGVPYDPHIWLVAHLAGVPQLAELLRRSFQAETDAARADVYRETEAAVEREALVVPLFIPERLAVARRGVGEVVLASDGYHVLEVR